jgi:putative ABC transport system permease protein
MLLQDARFAFRVLLKNPAFTLIAIVSLALGIGANSAMFSLADALLLRPLPVANPGTVVTVEGRTPSNPNGRISYRDYLDFRSRSKSLDNLVAFTLTPFAFSANKDALPQIKYGLLVSGTFLSDMGVQPELGRGFRPDEDQVPGRDAVIVLGHDFWQQQFGGDRSVVGRLVRLNGVDFTVIGVLPPQFTGMDQYFHAAALLPMAMAPRLAQDPKHSLLEGRDNRALLVKGRLRPGAGIKQAEAELVTIAKSLERAYPETNRDQSVVVKTEMQARVDDDTTDASLVGMLMGLAGLVLIVACANVANMLLSRSRSRVREMAVRIAIGAGRSRLIRQLLTESLMIGLGAGVLGLVVAYGGILFLRQIEIPTDLPIAITFTLDSRLILFSLAVSVASVLFFGLAPAIAASRTDLVPALKASDADAAGKPRVWGRNLLVVAQVALSLVLLVVTAMMYRGFQHEFSAGVGFRTDHLVTMSFDPTLVRFTNSQAQQFYQQLVERAAAVPGVKSAALTRSLPMAPEQNNIALVPEGHIFPKGVVNDSIFGDTVDSHFFATMGVSIVSGRGFRESDSETAPKVAVINQVLAQKYWPNQDPIGKRFQLDDAKGPWVQIVGVAKTGKYLWIGEPPTEYVYLPLAQNFQPKMTLLVESAGEAASLVVPLRGMVRGIDANQPMYDIRTMEDFYRKRVLSAPNMVVQMVGSMGLLGLVLAMVGLYGLVAYSVSRRTREFGIRMAIGAQGSDVLRAVMRQGLTLALSGIAVGLVLSVGAQRLVTASFLTAAKDPAAYWIVPPILLTVTLIAAFIPALRASRIDPIRALRDE